MAWQPYSTLLFDLDHTLLDSDESERMAFEATAADAGVDDHEALFETYQSINRGLWAAVERGEIGPEQIRVERFVRLVDERRLMVDPERLAERFVTGLSEEGNLYPGARALLEHVCERSRLALVTNGLGDVQRRRIERLGLEQYFEAVIISGEVGTSKPGRAIFDLTFRALGHPAPGDAVMIGDNLSSDIRGGADYGIATCWYNPQQLPLPEPHTVTHQAQTLDEMRNLVRGGRASLPE